MKQPIAILHVLYEALGEREHPIYGRLELRYSIAFTREGRPPNRFYIEWLDQHNPREVIKESEAGDE